TTPPACSVVPTSNDLERERPASRKTVGSQLARKYRLRRFMKFKVHRSRVPAARPSPNNFKIGTPPLFCSGMTYSLLRADCIVGSIRFSHLPINSEPFPRI